MKGLLFLLMSILILTTSFAQNEDQFYRTYPKQAYLEDFATLAKTLVDVHPSPHEFTPASTFWATVNEQKTAITSETTFGEFIWRCSEMIANLNCVHSGLGCFNQESQILPVDLRFPLEVRFIEKNLYVLDQLTNARQVEQEAKSCPLMESRSQKLRS